MNSNVKYKNFKVFNRGASSVCEQFSSERCEGSLKARQAGRQTGGQSELDLQARRDPVPPGNERRGEPHGPVVERPHQGGQH